VKGAYDGGRLEVDAGQVRGRLVRSPGRQRMRGLSSKDENHATRFESAVPCTTRAPKLKVLAGTVGTGVGRGLGSSERESVGVLPEMGDTVPLPKDRHQVLLHWHSQVEGVGCGR
jgi:hypothetical protein